MCACIPPREAGKLIADSSKDVTISQDGVCKTAQQILDLMKQSDPGLTMERWRTHVLNPKQGDERAVQWIFLVDVLNFSFWSESKDVAFKIKYAGQEWTGYWSLCAAINRALDEDIAVLDADYMASITMEQLKHILRSDSAYNMPMLEERLSSIREAGTVLKQKFGGSFVNAIKQCDKSAVKLLQLIVDNFPSFRDTAQYEDKTVALYKRAQILIGDTWCCCQGQGHGEFKDIDAITMFADYRIPQALVWFGALQYSDSLMTLLSQKHMFKSGEKLEVEIRGCTIWAVELIVDEMKKLASSGESLPEGTHINPILVDHFLWDKRREMAEQVDQVPMHRIRCIYY